MRTGSRLLSVLEGGCPATNNQQPPGYGAQAQPLCQGSGLWLLAPPHLTNLISHTWWVMLDKSVAILGSALCTAEPLLVLTEMLNDAVDGRPKKGVHGIRAHPQHSL